VCDDNSICTTDSCNPATGCVFTDVTAVVCNDNNACTDDRCDQTSGCYHVNNSAPCSDGNPCTSGDTCGGGICIAGTPIAPPPETQALAASADKTTYIWAAAAFATQYDVVRGGTGAFPVGPGGGDEVCFDNLAGTTVVDAAVPAPGAGFWYLARGENSCGIGTFGTHSNGSPRVTTTCP
jgi:hypothetical protein